jgi:metal-responsive CopG/Arc/MetJ family transcriptional regulator
MQSQHVVRIQVALKQQQKEQLAKMACQQGVSTSELVRRAIDRTIRKEKTAIRAATAGAWSAQTAEFSLYALRREQRIFNND